MTLHIFCGSGGGTKGAFTAGVIDYLTGAGIQFDAWSGVSTGAIAAGYMSQFRPADQARAASGMKAIWLSLQSARDLYRGGIPRAIVRTILGRSGLFDFAPFERMLADSITRAPVLACQIGVVDLASGGYVSLFPTSKGELRQAILASCTMPGLFRPVTDYVDGGVRRVAPLAGAFELARPMLDVSTSQDIVIHMVNATPRILAASVPYDKHWLGRPWHAVARRSFDILEHTLIQADVREATRVNELVRLFDGMPFPRPPVPAWLSGKVAARILRYDPTPDAPRYGTLDVDPVAIRQMIGHGATVAADVVASGIIADPDILS